MLYSSSSRNLIKSYQNLLRLRCWPFAFTLEGIYAWNFISGWNNFCLWWNVFYCLHNLCRDEVSSRDEFISVDKTEMKFHTGMKEEEKRRVNTSSRDGSFQWACFQWAWRIYSIWFRILTCLNIMKVRRKLL